MFWLKKISVFLIFAYADNGRCFRYDSVFLWRKITVLDISYNYLIMEELVISLRLNRGRKSRRKKEERKCEMKRRKRRRRDRKRDLAWAEHLVNYDRISDELRQCIVTSCDGVLWWVTTVYCDELRQFIVASYDGVSWRAIIAHYDVLWAIYDGTLRNANIMTRYGRWRVICVTSLHVLILWYYLIIFIMRNISIHLTSVCFWNGTSNIINGRVRILLTVEFEYY